MSVMVQNLATRARGWGKNEAWTVPFSTLRKSSAASEIQHSAACKTLLAGAPGAR